jgi:hypothetical protein
MKTPAKTLRRTDAQRLVNELRSVLDQRMETQYGISKDDYTGRTAFLAGYLGSLVALVASSSPTALAKLKDSVDWAKSHNNEY